MLSNFCTYNNNNIYIYWKEVGSLCKFVVFDVYLAFHITACITYSKAVIKMPCNFFFAVPLVNTKCCKCTVG